MMMAYDVGKRRLVRREVGDNSLDECLRHGIFGAVKHKRAA
jgi:hypothetical protein